MKKAVCLLLSCLIVLSISGCRNNTAGTSNQNSSSANSSGESTKSNSTQTQSTETPKVTGTFIQPWLCEDWSVSQWKSHYDKLLEVGIDTMIIQWVANTPYSKFNYVTYPSEYARSHKASGYKEKPEMLENALNAAEAKGVKVFVGINLSDEWWNNEFTSASWCESQANVGNTIAKETYTLYKAKYPHAFYGWYWAWEFYNQNNGYEKNWSDMMNIHLDYLTTLDSSLPILFSPFISGEITSTPIQLEIQWKNFFKQTHFRKGDIFCSQDSVGASELPLDYLDGQIGIMKKAAQVKPEVKFWINCENFVGKSGGNPAPMERFLSQLKMASKYTDTIITFSYSHYYADNAEYHNAYKAYLGK